MEHSSNGTAPALADIARGYGVTPLKGKRPIRRDWNESPIKRADEWPVDANTHGIVLSAVDRLLLVDIDRKNGKDGTAPLRDWCRAVGLDVRPYALQRTPSGGLHYLGRVPAGFDMNSLPNGATADGIDVLSRGKQFVRANGSNGYTELRPLPPIRDLPQWPVAFLEMLAGLGCGSSDADAPPQDDLRAPSFEQLAELVSHVPNGGPEYASRDAYINVGYAIKAAWPGDDGAAFDLWSEWAGRWTDGENEPETLEADWKGLKGPYRLGYDYLRSLVNPVEVAQEEFDAVPDAAPSEVRNEWAEWATPLEDIQYRNPPSFLVQGLVLEHDINFIAGEGGSYKTTGALAIACAVASGANVFGCEVIGGPRKVLVLSEEDDDSIIKNRAEAICAGQGMTYPAGYLRVIAQRGFRFGDKAAIARFRDFVRQERFALVVMDPMAEMLDGEENSNSEGRPVVQFLRSITAQGGPAVLIVHHAGKGAEGKSKVDRFMRGASAFKNGARSVLGFTARDDGFKIESLKLNRGKKPAELVVYMDVEPDERDPHGLLWRSVKLSGVPAWNAEQTDLQEKMMTLLAGEPLSGEDLKKALREQGFRIEDIWPARNWLEDRGQIGFEKGPRGAKMWKTLQPGADLTLSGSGIAN
jgi:hypothetical protein